MNGSINYNMSNFWDYLVNCIDRALYDSKNYNFNFSSFNYKKDKIDEHLLGFIYGALFVASEEETIDKEKSYNKLSKEIIKRYVRNETNVFPRLFPSTTLSIKGPNSILNDEEQDEYWVLACIKKNLAHGNFSIDNKRGTYIIKNDEAPNKIDCEVGIYWLAHLGMEIDYSRKNVDTLIPFVVLEPYFWNSVNEPLKTEEMLKEFIDSNYIFSPFCFLSGDMDERIRAKDELNRVWLGVRVNRNIEKVMSDMAYEVPNGKMRAVDVKRNGFLSHLIQEVGNTRNFYEMDANSQNLILEQLIYDYNVLDVHTNVVDYGLHLLAQQVGLSEYLGYEEYVQSENLSEDRNVTRAYANKLYNVGSFYKDIGALYLFGLFLFAGNKDQIYDSYVDYESFDLSDVIAYDYVGGKQLKKTIDELSESIAKLEDQQLGKSGQKKLEKKQIKKDKLMNLLIDDLSSDAAIKPSNKEFFHRVRNAISHRQIHLVYNDDGTVDDKIVLVDEDKFLTFIEPRKLIGLLTDKRFYEAIRMHENGEPIKSESSEVLGNNLSGGSSKK